MGSNSHTCFFFMMDVNVLLYISAVRYLLLQLMSLSCRGLQPLIMDVSWTIIQHQGESLSADLEMASQSPDARQRQNIVCIATASIRTLYTPPHTTSWRKVVSKTPAVETVEKGKAPITLQGLYLSPVQLRLGPCFTFVNLQRDGQAVDVSTSWTVLMAILLWCC